MKKKIILAALLMSMAVTVYAEEVVWKEQTATEDVTYAESVFEEETISEEQTASEEPEYVFDETAIIEEEIKDEDVVSEEIAFDENADQATELIQEESVFEEDVVTEEAAGDESSSTTAVAVEGLIYTGEPQTLITPLPGTWLYSLDGEEYSTELPTGVNAGEYTVYMKNGETVEVVTVTIAKADVVFTAPVVNTTSYEPDEGNEADEAAPAGEENETDEEPAETGEGVAYAAGEAVVEEVVFEE